MPAFDEGAAFRIEDVVAVGDGFLAHGWIDGGASDVRLLWWSPDGRRWVDIEGPAIGEAEGPTAMASLDGQVFLFWPGRIAVGYPGEDGP